MQNWTFVKNALRTSVALFISHCFGHCLPPLPPQAMLKGPAMILGVKGPSNQHYIGGGGGMREFAVFLRKCPKTFGQDCSLCQINRAKRMLMLGLTVFSKQAILLSLCVSEFIKEKHQ